MIESPDRFEVRPHQNESIKIALEMAPKVLELLVPRTWNIIRFEEPVLVTSDEPVTMWNEPYPEQQFRGKGLANCDEIRLPLDPRHMLILTLGAKPFDLGLFGTMPADPWALELNATTAYFGHRWIFASPSHPALEQVRELARTTPRHGIQAHFGGQVTDIIATL